MTVCVIDQSIWSRVEQNVGVADLVRQVARDHTIATCPPQVLEYCHDIQQALWDNGLPRAAGAVNLLIAAYAIVNDATVLSADRDYDSIALATGDRLRHEFVEVA